MIAKQCYKNALAVDELDRDLLKPFFYNKNLIYNFECLVDDGNIEDRENYSTHELKDKLATARMVINRLGFDSIVDTRQVGIEALRANFFELTKSLDLKRVAVLFGTGRKRWVPEDTSNKQLLGFINSILGDFSMGVRCVKKTVRASDKVVAECSYCLRIENNLDEVVRRRHARGRRMVDKGGLMRLPSIPEVSFLEA